MNKHHGIKRIKFSACSLISSVLFLVSTQASAIPIQIDFEGVISSSGSFADPTSNFSQGDLISGFWKFESTTPDSDSSSSRGAYAQTGSPVFQINIGSYFFQTNTSTIQILNDSTIGIGTIDAYDILGRNAISNISGLDLNAIQITLRDTMTPLDAILSDALLLTAPDPASFDQINQSQGQITGRYFGDLFFMNLQITSTFISPTSAPEPGVLLLLMVGLTGMVVAGKRQSWKK